MKKDSEALADSPHIIVTEVPPGFLKRKNVRSHFSRFGSIVRMSIQSTFCVITFETHQQAKHAVSHGTHWKDMPLKIDFTSTHDPFGTDDAIINEELNWFAEDPEDSFKPKGRSSKSKSHSKPSDVPPKKLIRRDFKDDDETSKSSEDNKLKQRSSDATKSRDKKNSATMRFLEGMRSYIKSEIKKIDSKASEETKISSEEKKIEPSSSGEINIFSSPSEEIKIVSGLSEPMQIDSRPSEKNKIDSKIPEEMNIDSRTTEENKFLVSDSNVVNKYKENLTAGSKPMTLMEAFKFTTVPDDEGKRPSFFPEFNAKPKLSIENKTSSIFGNFKFISNANSGLDLGPFNLTDNQKTKSKHIEENKPCSKSLEDFKFFSKHSDENNSALNPPEETKAKLKEENNVLSKNLDDNGASTSKTVEESKAVPKQSEFSDENKSIIKSQEENRSLVKSNDSLFQCRTAISLQDKLNILEERDRLIRLKLDKVTRMDSSIQGTCPDMCPEKERVLRELMGIIAPYEAHSDGRMDHSKAVKEYARSSADQEEPLPHDLRPEPVLTMTMTYLINCIISRVDEVADENQSNWYDFCWGRLRAIRKDIIQQQLCDKNTVVILEQCARFHIACYDRLWGTSKSQFDDKINTETLVNCLQSLIHMYEDLNKEGVSCPNEAEFKAYLILLKINSGFLMSEYQSYSKGLKESKLVREAVKIHLAYNNNMYSTFFKLAKQTSYLNACLMQRFFQHVRIQALNTTVKAHCVPNKSSNISVQYIMGILKLDSPEDCISFCESMGLTLNDEDKSFRVSRGDFYITDNIHKIEAPSSLVLKKRVPIAEAVVGNKNTLPIYLNHTVHDSFTEDGLLKESALDASDQEEKMLRDDVERKLLASQLKATFRHKLQRASSIGDSMDKFEEDSAKTVTEEPSEVNEPKVNEVELSNKGKVSLKEDVVDFSLESDNMDTKTDDTIDNEKDKSNKSPPSLLSPKIPPIQVIPPIPKAPTEFTFPLSTFQPKVHFKPPSPMPRVMDGDCLFTVPANPPPFLSKPTTRSKINTSVNLGSPKTYKPSKFFLKSLRPKDLEKPNIPKIVPEKRISTIKKSPTKDEKEKIYMDKLKKKLSENMKRVSARKYLRIWKEKAAKLKSSKIELETMLLYNMTVKEYIKLWGKPPLRRSLNVAKRLSTRKNANLMVQLILHTDIVDKIDKNVRKIGRSVINALGEKSVKQAEIWGNIAQPNPVFCKIVFALPPQPEGGTSFPMKLKSWCQAAFYTRKDSQISAAEVSLSDSGVPVCFSVCVVEGHQQLEACTNLTALVVIRARDWETTKDTENRILKLISLRNHPIPIAVLNVGQHIDVLDINHTADITHFEQCLWTDSRTVERVLRNLAHNVHLCNLKVKPFCSVLEVYSEKLFDLLQQDRYFHDGLDEVLMDPNNIIYFYNLLVEKIEEEIIDCKVHNYFGTAYEFRKDIKWRNNSLVFPDNYNDNNFQKSLAHRCLKVKLKPFKSDFKETKEVMLFFKHYCDDIGCLNILKKLVRHLKLPDEDENVNLRGHLQSVHWFTFIEFLIKELLTSHLLTFSVVLREDVIKKFIDSHFWFNTSIMKKMT